MTRRGVRDDDHLTMREGEFSLKGVSYREGKSYNIYIYLPPDPSDGHQPIRHG